MSATNQAEQNAITLPERAAVALGESANEARLRELVTKSAGILTVTNADGREEAHRAAMVLRTTRTTITNTGKAAREDATAFSKAVIAMEKDLIAIIEPEELRVLKLRDAFDAEEKARKDALIAQERARVEAIQAVIQTIRDTPLRAAEMDSVGLSRTIDALGRIEPVNGQFAEFADDAAAAIAGASERIQAMIAKALTSEAATIAAEEARIAEVARIEAERAELAQLRAAAAETARLAAIENERIANEHAATAKRLADQEAAQELALKQLRDEAAANLKAAADAQAEANRREQAERDRVAADLKRQLDEQQAAIAAERKALDDEKAAAAKLIADHAEGLADNAQYDIDAAESLARCTATAQAMLTNGRSLVLPESATVLDAMIDAADDDCAPTDREIIENYCDEFGGTPEQAFLRISRMVMDALDPTGEMMRAKLAA